MHPIKASGDEVRALFPVEEPREIRLREIAPEIAAAELCVRSGEIAEAIEDLERAQIVSQETLQLEMSV